MAQPKSSPAHDVNALTPVKRVDAIVDRYTMGQNRQAHVGLSRPELRSFGMGYLYRWGSRVLPYVPPRLGYRICEYLGLLAPLTPGWSQILVNLKHVLPEETESARRRYACGVVINLLKNYYDLLRSHALSETEIARDVDIQGLENGLTLLAREKRAIVTIPHMGNFSLVAEPMAARIGAPLMVVVEQMIDPEVHKLLNSLRRRRNVEIVELGRATARTIMRGLHAGKVIILASDRTVVDATVEVEFFGQPAEVPAGPALLALRTGAPLLTAYTYRQPSNRSTVVIDPPIALGRRSELQADVRRTMQAVIRIFESYIRHHPSQWLITEPVWKTA